MTTFRKLPMSAPTAAIKAQAIGSGASRALSIAGEIIREVIVARPWERAYENFGLAGGGAVLRWHAHLARGFTGGTPVPPLKLHHYGNLLGFRRVFNNHVVDAQSRSRGAL